MTSIALITGAMSAPLHRTRTDAYLEVMRVNFDSCGVQAAEQLADVMAWLLGEGAARLAGQRIAVDGGFTTVRPIVKSL